MSNRVPHDVLLLVVQFCAICKALGDVPKGVSNDMFRVADCQEERSALSLAVPVVVPLRLTVAGAVGVGISMSIAGR
jgi:hypothetical protein